MAKSIFTIFHTFTASFLTNTTVSSEYTLLLRIVVWWKVQLVDNEERYLKSIEDSAKASLGHLPNLNNFVDVQNLLALLNFADMAWVVTPDRYLAGIRKKPLEYRTAKDASDKIRDWLYHTFDLVTLEGDGNQWRPVNLKAMSLEYLMQHCRLLVRQLTINQLHGVYSENLASDSDPMYVSSEMAEDAIEDDICSLDVAFLNLWMKRKKEEKVNLTKLHQCLEELGKLGGEDGQTYETLAEKVKGLEWADTGNTYAWLNISKYRCIRRGL